MKIGNKEFDVKNKTYVMGILNVTPDSFSDGGKYHQMDNALKRTQQMVEEGADIIDICGESTRPGYQLLSEEEEMERVLPILEMIRKEVDVPISLDTYKSKVAKNGIKAGADFINDIWGLKYDSNLAKVIAESGVACCLMHNRASAEYKDYMQDVVADLKESLYLAENGGIKKDRIFLDPGVGFAKTYQNNLEIINRLEDLAVLGYPILLGTSRKSVIGLTLDLPVTQRLEGTLVTTTIAVLKGCGFVRVHDVLENVRTIKMAEAIKYSSK